MRKKSEESIEDWGRRVQQYEYGHALQRIAKGESVEIVIQDMGRRIQQKILHPVIEAIKQTKISEYNIEKSRKEYEETYLKKYDPKPDHVDYD